MLEVSREFEIGYETVRKWMRAYREENRLTPKEAYRQEPYKLNWEEVGEFVKKNPDWYQIEYALYFKVSPGQICKVLKRLGITRKKSLTYQEQDEKKVRKYHEELERTKKEQEEKLCHPLEVIYVDESAIKEEVTREYAYALKGKKVEGKTQGKQTHKINIVAGINGNEMIAPFIFEGTMD